MSILELAAWIAAIPVLLAAVIVVAAVYWCFILPLASAWIYARRLIR